MAFSFSKIFSSLRTAAPSLLPQKIVGIDFGSGSIKVVELTQREGVVTLTAYGELQLGPYGEQALGEAVTLAKDKQVQSLVDVLRESNITATDGVLSLPLHSSFVTVMSVQTDSEEELDARVRVEARKYIPVPINEVFLNWVPLEQVGEAATNMQEVLVAAIQHESLNTMTELMGAVKMTSQPSEIEIFSTIRALSEDAEEPIAIIDLGARTSKMYIARKGLLHRLHRVQVGGSTATKALSKVFECDFLKAENIKRNYTPEVDRAADIKQSVIATYERPMQEFKRLLDQYESRSGVAIKKISLTGGGANFSELAPFASYTFDRPAEVANAFEKVEYPAFMEDALKEISPSFTVAIGAALRPFSGA